MGSVSNNVSFGNEGIYRSLQKGGEDADAKLQKQLGGYTKEQLSNLKSIKAEHFRQVVNYVNPKNKGAACFTSDLKLTKCNNKVDIGSLRIGLNAQKNVLMRQTFANALAPGLKYVTDTDKLNALLSAVTGKSVIIAGKKPGAEIMLGGKDGIVFSTDRLERKDIREAFKIYDESFNTVKGRISVLEAMLKSAGLNEADGSKWSVKNFIDHVGSENFVDGLVRELNEKFNMPEDRVRSLLNEMLAVSEDKDKAEKSEVKSEGEYVDRSDAMKLSSDTFLEKLNELEEAINQAAKEKDLNRDLAVLLRNHAADPRQISNPKIREKLEGLLQDAVARFRGVGKNLINRPLSAFSSDFGGKRPLNIFLDMQFDKVLNTLLDKYSGKIGSGNFAKDLAAGSQMYSDMVEIASAFLDKVNLLETAYQNHVRTVSPNLFTQQDDQVVDLNVNNVNVHLEKMDNLDVMAESKELRDFEFDSTRVFDLVIKASALGVDVTDGSGKKLRIPSRVGAGIALESMVKTFAEKLDVYQFYKDIINGADTKTKGAVCKLGGNLLENVKKDLNAYGAKLKFCEILGNAKAGNDGKIALTSRITKSMNEAFALIEEQLNKKDLFATLKRFFASDVDKGLENVASKIFQEQVLSSLLSRFYSVKTEEAAKKIENGDKSVDISATYSRTAPLLLAVEKLAGKLMDSLDKGNAAFKKVMAWVENNKKKLGLDDEGLAAAKKAMVAEYETQLGKALQTVFDGVDFNRLDGIDVKDQEAVVEFAEKLGNDIAKDLVSEFGNKVKSVETVFANIAAENNSGLDGIRKNVKEAFAYTDAEISGDTLVFSSESGPEKFECRADKLLFGDSGVVKSVFENVCNRKTFATYLQFAKACASSKKGFTADVYMKDNANKRMNELVGEKTKIVDSMKGYLNSLTGAVFKELQGTFQERIRQENQQRLLKNNGPLYDDDNGLAKLARQATAMFLRDNEEMVGGFVKGELENAYMQCVDRNGKLRLPKFDEASVKKMFGAKGKASPKIGDFLDNAAKIGVGIAHGLQGELEKTGACVQNHPEFGKMIDPKDEVVSIALGTYPADKKSSEMWKKYGFLTMPSAAGGFKPSLDYQLFGAYVEKKIFSAPSLTIGLMGRTKFCEKIVDDFKSENHVEKFKKYLDECLEAFKKLETFGFSEAEVNSCRSGAIYRHLDDAPLSEKILDVGAAVKQFDYEVFTLLQRKVATLKRDSAKVGELFMAVEKYVQNHVDEQAEFWEKDCLGVGDNPSPEARFASEMQKAVLKRFNAKFVTELLNQTWLKDGVEDEVVQAIRSKGREKVDISQFLREDDLEQRIEKLNLVVTNMMDGIYAANNGSAFKKLIRESIRSLEDSNPEKAKVLKEFYKGNRQESVQTLITNLESLDFYKEMISSAASQYWNDCCKSGVFDKIKTEASIELKPVEDKPVEQKPVEEKPVEQKPVEPEAFSIDFSKGDDAKAQTLKEVVINVLTGGKVSQEIGNLNDADFENAVKVLDDDGFLRDLYSKKFDIKFEDGVWRDVQKTLKDTFVNKYKESLKAGIQDAFNRRKDGEISFAKTELSNAMFKDAYDFVLRTRWQHRIAGNFGLVDPSDKQKLLIHLGELFKGEPATALMTTAKGDRQAVRVLVEKREAMQMLLLGEIVPMLPIDQLFPSDEDKRGFINEEAPDQATGRLKMQKIIMDCLQSMSESQSGIGAGVKPDQKGTLEQRLAFYRDFCVKSADRIETTRVGFNNGLSRKYVHGDGFSRLIMSDLLLQDDGDVTKKFGGFGLKPDDKFFPGLAGTAVILPDKIRDVRNAPIADRDEHYKYLSSFEEFSNDLKAVQGIVSNATKESGIYKVANSLFGSSLSGGLTAKNFAEKGGMGAKLGGLLDNLQQLFDAAIRHELDKRESVWADRDRVVNDPAAQNEWKGRLREHFRGEGVAEMNIEPQVAQELDALIKLHGEYYPGLTTDEANEICGKVLDLVVKGAAHKGSAGGVESNATDQDVIDLLGGNATLIESAISDLRNLTPATEAGKHRDSFSGFVQRYAVLKEIIRFEST